MAAIRPEDPSSNPNLPGSEGQAFDFSLRVGGEVLQFRGTMPPGSCRAGDLLPLFWSIGQAILDAVLRQPGHDQKVSCGPACGACCRQAVPVSETEAGYLRDVVIPSLDEPQRNRVLTRIREASERLRTAGLEETLREMPEESDPARRQAIGVRYFLAGIPCPFLEDESCSIHPQRPMACREYLVTSPARHCSTPSDGNVRPVEIPVKASHALIRLDKDSRNGPGWTPMLQALLDSTADVEREVDPSRHLEKFLNALA